jgi:hypothetical protein
MMMMMMMNRLRLTVLGIVKRPSGRWTAVDNGPENRYHTGFVAGCHAVSSHSGLQDRY